MDVSKSLESLDALGELAADGIALWKALQKGGLGWFEVMKKSLELAADAKRLSDALPGAVPELKDLQGSEVAQLGAGAYNAAKKVLDALKA